MPDTNKPPRSVLITGCSAGGIGDALAKEFKRRGLRVFATARDVSKVAPELATMAIEVLQLDVTDAASVKRAAEEVGKLTGGRLDILVNNSGIGYMVPFTDTDLSIARQVFETNVFSVFSVTSAFMPYLIETRGLVVNMSSISDRLPSGYHTWYNASKAALTMLGDNMRLEFQPLGVRAVSVISGSVGTKFMDNVINLKDTPAGTGASEAQVLKSTTDTTGPATAANNAIPPTSYYYPLREVIEKRDWMRNVTKFMNVDDYVRQLAGDLLKKNPPHRIYRGSSSRLSWAMEKFVPTGWLDGTLRKICKLDAFEPNIPKAKAVEATAKVTTAEENLEVNPVEENPTGVKPTEDKPAEVKPVVAA